MTGAAEGQTVRFHYTGKLENGAEFDSSADRGPVEAELGSGKTLPAIESALIGMAVGEKKTVEIAAANAFGPHDPALLHKVQRSQMPDGMPIEPGQRLKASSSDGQEVMLTIVEVGTTEVTLDANHPLAGRDVTFDLELVEIV